MFLIKYFIIVVVFIFCISIMIEIFSYEKVLEIDEKNADA